MSDRLGREWMLGFCFSGNPLGSSYDKRSLERKNPSSRGKVHSSPREEIEKNGCRFDTLL